MHTALSTYLKAKTEKRSMLMQTDELVSTREGEGGGGRAPCC